MANPTDKQLAKWAAEFLVSIKAIVKIGNCYYLAQNTAFCVFDDSIGLLKTEVLFHDDYMSPILMHLGIQKLEQEEYAYMLTKHEPPVKDGHDVYVWRMSGRKPVHSRVRDENIFLAFWSAVRKAVEDV